MTKIGFIGLGNMGAPMARNLVLSGHDVCGFDVRPFSVEGVQTAANLHELCDKASIIVSMLPDGGVLGEVAAQIHPLMAPGSLHVDCSTVEVERAREVAEQAAIHGLLALDAPVSGGVGGAEAGTLTFMVGGEEQAFEKAVPLFGQMGQKAVHCGHNGAGQAAKICNNMILAITMIGTCETFGLADRLGLDRQKLFDVVSTSSGYSWSMNAYCPAPGVGPLSPADKAYAPGFAAELMVKDLGLAQKAACSVNADTPLGAMAKNLYEEFVEQGRGQGVDFSAILRRFEAL